MANLLRARRPALILLKIQLVVVLAAAVPASGKPPSKEKATAESTGAGQPVLWRDPIDLETRDLIYGAGGQQDAPRTSTFTFIKEDLDGSNPKLVVQDDAGVKWKIKLGPEAKPEVAASRLVWAVGYFTDEDYFLPDASVLELPGRLHRGQELFRPDGSVHDVRLKREVAKESKSDTWRWRRDPFTGSRELNGLRVLMAVINNWDLKDANNSVYTVNTKRIYLISDLGASFGTTHLVRGHNKSRGKGELAAYRESRFITRVTPDSVDFATPGRPTFLALGHPNQYFSRLRLRWIGRHILRSDAKWMGQLLARLSLEQVRDAFRAAGYSEPDADAFAAVVESRIAELNDL